jgi:2-keto-4-pentenoate hydratase/2-oxohepta-3-ene-1,7-dioic acid hydratase in catechol pathway
MTSGTLSCGMKYLTFSLPADPHYRVGLLHQGRVVDLDGLMAGDPQWPARLGVLDVIRRGPDVWRHVSDATNTRLGDATAGFAPDAVQWHAPIPRPAKNVFCLGLNYMLHLRESAAVRNRPADVPKVPVVFTKPPTSVGGPYDDVPWDPAVTSELDYEVELGVVIGLSGKNIPRDRALEHVFGYTCINDVSARDLQRQHIQWFKGKSLDGACPMGPVIVTADEFGDPQAKRIGLRLNGDQRQDATTADMIFPIDAIIEQLSRGMTLEAGDVIATGTPSGVGMGRTPQEFMKDGDVIETEIEGIGTMRNRVVAIR